ncbi:MAG: hypothetical protein KJ066_22635 [Acidobacteria bacterium]|nr:hypothetical protein [Acidobacteriota bacterium]
MLTGRRTVRQRLGGRGRLSACLALAVSLPAGPSYGQDAVTVRADFAFYGDNTEFANPFRTGDTLLGNWGQVFADVQLGDRVRLRGGLFGNWRYGDIRRVGQLSPVLALVIGSERQRFVFGTLETVRRNEGIGPDLAGPHGLPPPVQVETLAFTRPFEAGLQWLVDLPRLEQDAWIHWQRLNTPRQREQFDAGVVGRVGLGSGFGVPYVWHVVHRGGQRYAAGPVADSHAGGAGISWGGRTGRVDRVSIDTLVLGSVHVPDREESAASLRGRAWFVRAAVREGPWRAHATSWRARDFVKEEGDPNYQALRRDGSFFRNVRDYAEVGVTRVFRPAAEVEFETSARVHVVERQWAYSYRLLARVGLVWHVTPTREHP